MARIDHTAHTHPRTAAARAACRKNGLVVDVPAVVTPPIKMTGAVARRMARQAAAADALRPTINTPAGPVRVGSVILADVRGGSPTRYTIRTISDNIKNDAAGWDADGRWGYADQVIRVITF